MRHEHEEFGLFSRLVGWRNGVEATTEAIVKEEEEGSVEDSGGGGGDI